MPKRHKISLEEVAEIQKIRKKNKDKTIDKWLEVLLLQAEGKSRAEISAKTGFAKQYITELVSEYRKSGLLEYSQKQYQGNHRNMSVEDEAEFFRELEEKAATGQMITVSEISEVYFDKLGKKPHNGIYSVLHRSNWRVVTPRSKHPNKASDEEIESSKKLTM